MSLRIVLGVFLQTKSFRSIRINRIKEGVGVFSGGQINLRLAMSKLTWKYSSHFRPRIASWTPSCRTMNGMLYCRRPSRIKFKVRQWLATWPFRPSYPFAWIVRGKAVSCKLRLSQSWLARVASINANPFAPVSTSISRSIPIPFFAKVHGTVRGEPPIKLDKSISWISNAYDPKVETFLRGSRFPRLVA